MSRPFYGIYKDFSNQRWGNLIAIRPTEKRHRGNVMWLFKCDCGNEIIRLPRLLGKGNKTHCGCVVKSKNVPRVIDIFAKDDNNKVYKVYLATAPNGKKYVGYTKQNLNKRIYGHNKNAKEGSTTHFSSALRKYNDMAWEIIQDNLSHKEAVQMEIDLIQKYNTFDKLFGYNMTKGGDGGVCTDGENEIIRRQKLVNFYASDEMRKAQSDKVKSYCNNPENSDMMSLIRGGKASIVLKQGRNL